jgi:hypothetical protein
MYYLSMNTDTGLENNGKNAPASRWTKADRSAWYAFRYSHPTLAESRLIRLDNGGWQICVGTHPPTFVGQHPGETRTELQRRVMRMYPIHAPNQRENQTDAETK